MKKIILTVSLALIFGIGSVEAKKPHNHQGNGNQGNWTEQGPGKPPRNHGQNPGKRHGHNKHRPTPPAPPCSARPVPPGTPGPSAYGHPRPPIGYCVPTLHNPYRIVHGGEVLFIVSDIIYRLVTSPYGAPYYEVVGYR